MFLLEKLSESKRLFSLRSGNSEGNNLRKKIRRGGRRNNKIWDSFYSVATLLYIVGIMTIFYQMIWLYGAYTNSRNFWWYGANKLKPFPHEIWAGPLTN